MPEHWHATDLNHGLWPSGRFFANSCAETTRENDRFHQREPFIKDNISAPRSKYYEYVSPLKDKFRLSLSGARALPMLSVQ